MSDLGWSTRLALYFYSTRNIVACSLALVGPVLLFAGVIRDYWILITLGLYAAGFFLTPPPRLIDTQLAKTLSLEALQARLHEIVEAALPAMPRASVARLESIRNTIDEVLPRLVKDPSGSDELFTVRETALRYLPGTLGNYLALPALFRTSYKVRDGKTAEQLLGEQLALLDDELKQVATNLARGDAEALLANGRFLESKFKYSDFLAESN